MLPTVTRSSLAAEGHTVVVTFLAILVGFETSIQLISGASGNALGSVEAAGVYTATGLIVDFGIRFGRRHRGTERGTSEVLWVVASVLWLIVGVPVAALLAPHYRLHGLAATFVAVVIVLAVDFVVGRASPWRLKWRRPE